MKLSHDRLVTTHVGSLPRPPRLAALLSAQENGEAVDADELAREKRAAVADVVRRQAETGIDVANDGEQCRVSYVTYVPLRMTGFAGESRRPQARDLLDFPDYVERQRAIQAAVVKTRVRTFNAPRAVADVRYEDSSDVDEECAMFDEALAQAGTPFAETFMTAASPGVIAFVMENAHYESHEAYVFALAREMKKEYDRIHARGYILQLDCPDMANEYAKQFWDKPVADYVKIVETHVAAMNEAIADIPRDRVRMHLCYGNYEGPHTHDPALEAILPVVYQANVGAVSIELANPRHQHEIKAIKANPPPPHMALIPGVIDTTTNFVEHEELVADRLCAAVDAVGDRERVIAGCDCGFGTFAGNERVVPGVVWAKLKSMADGARIASQSLWE